MAISIFVSSVVLDARGVAYPAIEDVRNGPGGTFPCVWSIAKFADPRRVAVGLCDVTPEQLILIELDSRVRVVDLPSDWKRKRWRNAAVGRRNALAAFASLRGLDNSRIGDNALLPDVLDDLMGQLRPGRSINHLANEMQVMFGVSL